MVKIFGPVPSRRLGRSLGINNIPPKKCPYSCVYCQLGRTKEQPVDRLDFYAPEEIARAVTSRIEQSLPKEEKIDYLTFVADGEPTLDRNLGQTINLLKPLGIKIAVITNASLIWREDVRSALCSADLVSLKVDSVREEEWRRINRPVPGRAVPGSGGIDAGQTGASLSLDLILEGIYEFAKGFPGKMLTETMLIQGLNDRSDSLRETGKFLAGINPFRAYLSVPIRPPAEAWVKIPEYNRINQAFQILQAKIEVEYLIGYEGNEFSFTGNAREDLLNITSVHPMKEVAVQEFLKKAGTDLKLLYQMVKEEELKEVEYKGEKFYLRNLAHARE